MVEPHGEDNKMREWQKAGCYETKLYWSVIYKIFALIYDCAVQNEQKVLKLFDNLNKIIMNYCLNSITMCDHKTLFYPCFKIITFPKTLNSKFFWSNLTKCSFEHFS